MDRRGLASVRSEATTVVITQFASPFGRSDSWRSLPVNRVTDLTLVLQSTLSLAKLFLRLWRISCALSHLLHARVPLGMSWSRTLSFIQPVLCSSSPVAPATSGNGLCTCCRLGMRSCSLGPCPALGGPFGDRDLMFRRWIQGF